MTAIGSGRRKALRFVLIIGIVNMFADMTYEGGRGEVGAFLGQLGASGFIVGLVAGGGELAGYAIRSIAGTYADRSGRYWWSAWLGYAVNLLSVPALALTSSVFPAAGLVVSERVGRGIRRPAVSAVIANAGQILGHGRAFGLNEALDQIGATVGPLIVALAIARSGSVHVGFAVLIVPALLALGFLIPAAAAGRACTPSADDRVQPITQAPRAFWITAAGGACIAAGYLDFALIAYRFGRDHVVATAAISVWFAAAMAVGAISAPLLGRLFDRYGTVVLAVAIAVSAAAAPLAFLGSHAVAGAGAALWGLGTAIDDTMLLAVVAGIFGGTRRATAFGVFDTIFGAAWFLGSMLCGWLVDHNVVALVVFSVAMQLASIPFFFAKDIRRGSLGIPSA